MQEMRLISHATVTASSIRRPGKNYHLLRSLPACLPVVVTEYVKTTEKVIRWED